MSFPTAHQALQAALARRGYTEPTPVQAAVLADDARARDLLVSAQTGSGKTVAFGLAMATALLGEAMRFDKPGAPLGLVVTPTRELAQQVFRELQWLYADTGARITTCVGGFDPRREQRALAGGVHIVVGTPGRLCDHLERGALVLARVQAAVLDEADEMLDMGFREDLERLLDAAPATRRTLLFSATIPKEIAAIAKRYQQKALRISTQSESDAHRDIEYHAVPIVQRERDLAVVNVLRYHEAAGALVFSNTRDGVTHLAANLAERGFSVVALSGELSQRERNVALQALRDGRARVCVATDVAARGLDFPDLGLVIHADLPQNKEVLVHRSGRTGRAGRHGVAILLVPEPARRYVERLLHAAHVDAQWMRAPTAEQIATRDEAAMVREIVERAVDDEHRAAAQALLAQRPAEELVALLVAQLRQARPAPEVLTEPRSQQGPIRTTQDRGTKGKRAPGPRPQVESRAGMRWFTINVGRSKNADPKWIVPLLCRRGQITKQQIGKIDILQRETRVEIDGEVSERFAEAVRRPDPKDKNIHIEPLDI